MPVVAPLILKRIGNRMKASAFRDLQACVMFWKFPKLHEPKASVIWELQIFISDHKSRNSRASSYGFLFIIYSQQWSVEAFMIIELFVLVLFEFLSRPFLTSVNQLCVPLKVYWLFTFSLLFDIVLDWQSKKDCQPFCFCFQLWRWQVYLSP